MFVQSIFVRLEAKAEVPCQNKIILKNFSR